jgi:phosphonate transport system permease protein
MGSLTILSHNQEQPFLEWQKGITRQRGKQVAIVVGLAALIALTSWRCEVHLETFILGLRKGIPLVGMFFPPEWKGFVGMLQPLAITTVMAAAATILGMCFSLPCALAASTNISPKWLRLTMRTFIALERGLPEVVQLLLLIAVFGLGPVPALVTLGVSSIGMLAKLLADAIEEIEPSMLEAVEGTGATRSQVIRYAVIPQILPALFAQGLFRFEMNVRAGVILGALGAGGIGYIMSTAMASMDYQRACMATLLTLALTFTLERISDFLRHHILQGGLLK